MIQELLGGTTPPNSTLLTGDRKIFSINTISTGGSSHLLEPSTVIPLPLHLPHHHSSLLSPPHPIPPSPSPSTSSHAAANSSPAAAENLRCPRCDSANTKFCYYNNYNLTQPRHFCKTCRRYWTKGGALRNVPIGGGCRKNKSPVSSASSVSSSSAAKIIKISEPLPPPPPPQAAANPVLWGSPQNSHLLSLLRSAQQNHVQNPNPNPNSNSLSVKEESQVGLDSVGQVPSLGLCSSFWRSSSSLSNSTSFAVADYNQSNGNVGIQELYQRLRTSSSGNNNNGYYNDQTAVVLTRHHQQVGSGSASPIVESTVVNGGGGDQQLGFWSNNNGNNNSNNSVAFSWTDLPTTTTNGAYP